MNVLFVYSLDAGLLKNGLLKGQERLQYGISYISSLLQKHGHHTSLVILSKLLSWKNIITLKKNIKQFDPQVICFSAIATEYDLIVNMARYVKRHYPHIYLLGGGVHITLNTEAALSADFDALCVGEGEYPTLELVEQLKKGQSPSGISNLWIKHGPEVERNPARCFLEDLDSLPFPDRMMWQKWMNQKDPEHCTVLLSRGCSFDCSYCSNHAISKKAQGVYVRHRSPGNIIAEIKVILHDFPTINVIYFEADTITSNVDWCMKLCSELELLNATARRPISFSANIRIVPRMDMRNIFSAFKRANFAIVNIGLESGSEKVRREVLRRNYSNDDFINVVKLAREHGLKILIYNLFGIPGETQDDFKETVRINRLCQPDNHITAIYYPYPGTDLYLACKKQGLLQKKIDPRYERERAVLDLPGFPQKKIQESYLYFDFYIYHGFDPEDILLVKCFILKHAILRFLHKMLALLIRVPFLKHALSSS
jgi:radical SAM superfamily enzyme YgiQ (UPF0313 family)